MSTETSLPWDKSGKIPAVPEGSPIYHEVQRFTTNVTEIYQQVLEWMVEPDIFADHLQDFNRLTSGLIVIEDEITGRENFGMDPRGFREYMRKYDPASAMREYQGVVSRLLERFSQPSFARQRFSLNRFIPDIRMSAKGLLTDVIIPFVEIPNEVYSQGLPLAMIPFSENYTLGH